MARYLPRVDIWTLGVAERAALQPGQHISAGQDGPHGRFYGEGRASTVAAWERNARGFPDGVRAYQAAIRLYAKSIGAR